VSKDEFTRRFRGELLLLLTEAWAVRNEGRASLAALLEQHHIRCREMLKDMYDALVPATEAKAPQNGAATQARK
jgi:hypothetical protein